MTGRNPIEYPEILTKNIEYSIQEYRSTEFIPKNICLEMIKNV